MQAQSPTSISPSGAAPRPSIDTGWPFLIAGILLLGATVLIPALDDLDEARWQRERALALEAHRLERLEHYDRYLVALEEGDPGLVQALAASQLNQIPADRSVILPTSGAGSGTADASVFPMLEPGPLRAPVRVKANSVLSRLSTSERMRPWLIGAGGVMLFVGLIPAVERSQRRGI
jgi:hypothetical protein